MMLLKYQYNYSVRNCFFLIIEKFKELVNHGEAFSNVLTNFYSEFDCLLYKYPVAKLHVYRLNEVSLKLICSYLINKK